MKDHLPFNTIATFWSFVLSALEDPPDVFDSAQGEKVLLSGTDMHGNILSR